MIEYKVSILKQRFTIFRILTFVILRLPDIFKLTCKVNPTAAAALRNLNDTGIINVKTIRNIKIF